MPLSAPVDLAAIESRVSDLETRIGFDAQSSGRNVTYGNRDRTARWVFVSGNPGRAQMVTAQAHTTGLRYFEVLAVYLGGVYYAVGVAKPNADRDGDLGASASHYAYMSSGASYLSGTFNGGYGTTYVLGNIIGVALDLTALTLTWFKNNVQVAAPVSVAAVPAGGYLGGVSFDTSGDACTVRTRAEDFTYAPPAGYSAWCGAA